MAEVSYRYRAHPFARPDIYRLGEDALIVDDGLRQSAVPYSDIAFVESFTVGFLGASGPYWRLILSRSGGDTITLSAAYRDPWRVVDASAAFDPFAHELHRRIKAASPDLEWVSGRYWLNRAGNFGGKLAVVLMRFVRHTGPDFWADVAARIVRRLGPRLRGHSRAIEQIALAFPDASPEEHSRIATGMWDNLARTAVEFTQLDRIWDHDPARPDQGRVIMDADSARILADIKAANRPTLHFSLHSGNWELVAICGAKYARCLVPYRRLKNQPLTDALVRMRVAAGVVPLAAGPALVGAIKREFGPGSALGMLIDQRYVRGVNVTFFGRPTMLNPLFARLARLYDCPIYGSRIVRRPNRQFSYQIVGPIEPRRDARGRIDVEATTQLLASMMEGWIREHPDQWMWLHRTWRDDDA